MPTLWPTPTHAASRMSDAIAPWISRDPETGVVHSVFRSALNISTGGWLLTIASTLTGGLPNGIVADLGPDLRRMGLRAGMPAHTCARRLWVDSTGLAIDLDTAVRWSPRLAAPIGGGRVAAARWRRRSRRTRAIAATFAKAGLTGAAAGLGPLLETGFRDADFGTAKRAGPILACLEVAYHRADRAGATAAARTLIGLGPGLTPSGDDALVGIEAASWALRTPMAGFLDDTLVDVDTRTTAVAATLLRHAAAGEFAERLHALLGALLGPDDAAIPAAIERAVAWGATSGTDCLVGVLLGLDAASRGDWTVD